MRKFNLLAIIFAVVAAMVLSCSVVAVGATNTAARKGDVNNDGSVDSLDAALVLRHDAGLIQFSQTQLEAADFNEDGVADSLDAATILKYDCGFDYSITRKTVPESAITLDIGETSSRFSCSNIRIEKSERLQDTYYSVYSIIGCDMLFERSGNNITGTIKYNETQVTGSNPSTVEDTTSVSIELTKLLIKGDNLHFAGSIHTLTKSVKTSSHEKTERVLEDIAVFEGYIMKYITPTGTRYKIGISTEVVSVSSSGQGVWGVNLTESGEGAHVFIINIEQFADRTDIQLQQTYSNEISRAITQPDIEIPSKTRSLYSGSTNASLVITASNGIYRMKGETVKREFSN